MRLPVLIALLGAVSGCGRPSWPTHYFPKEVNVERVLFAEGGGGMADTCEAMVAELTSESAARLLRMKRQADGKWGPAPPEGWLATPIRPDTTTKSYFKNAFSGCNNEGRRPLGDLTGALERPGAFYKIMDGGQGIGVINQPAKLVGFFYFG